MRGPQREPFRPPRARASTVRWRTAPAPQARTGPLTSRVGDQGQAYSGAYCCSNIHRRSSVAQAGYRNRPVAGYNPGLVIDCSHGTPPPDPFRLHVAHVRGRRDLARPMEGLGRTATGGGTQRSDEGGDLAGVRAACRRPLQPTVHLLVQECPSGILSQPRGRTSFRRPRAFRQ